MFFQWNELCSDQLLQAPLNYIWNPVCMCCLMKCRMQSRERMPQLVVQPTTSPLRSCTSPILSRWQFLHMRCKCHITSRVTRHTIDFVQWVSNTAAVRELCVIDICCWKHINFVVAVLSCLENLKTWLIEWKLQRVGSILPDVILEQFCIFIFSCIDLGLAFCLPSTSVFLVLNVFGYILFLTF